MSNDEEDSVTEKMTRDEFARNVEFVAFKVEVRSVLKQIKDQVNQIFPLYLSRSGDLAKLDQVQRDISALHEKFRDTSVQISNLDSRMNMRSDSIEEKMDSAVNQIQKDTVDFKQSTLNRYGTLNLKITKLISMIAGGWVVVQIVLWILTHSDIIKSLVK
jgi:DNA repair exonuclease SbcCD ATPase subunit